ncbi:hypothetical protein ACU686_40240 [Yinghuangia aomiensis]
MPISGQAIGRTRRHLPHLVPLDQPPAGRRVVAGVLEKTTPAAIPAATTTSTTIHRRTRPPRPRGALAFIRSSQARHTAHAADPAIPLL